MSKSGQDLGRLLYVKQSINPADHTATIEGGEVDCTLCPVNCLVRVTVGAAAIADASKLFTFTIEQATATGGTFSAADAAQYDFVPPAGSSTDWDGIINATTEADEVYSFNFRMKRTYDFLKVVATETGAAQIIFGATIEFEPSTLPATGA